LTVNASSARIDVGQVIPPFTVQYDGFVLSDGPSSLGGTLTFQLPAGATAKPGLYPVVPGGLTATNYAIAYVDGFLNVVAPASTAPLVTVQSAHWQVRRPGHGKTSRVLVISFSGLLDPDAAQDIGAYRLTPVPGGRGQKVGPRGNKPIALGSAVYNPAALTVSLTLRGKLPSAALQLSVNASLVRDAQGRPIDGNRDGQPGGNAVLTLRRS
jgi:hypothetical protein